MLEAIKVRLKLKDDQVSFFEQHAGASRWVYNQALDAQIQNYNKTGSFLSYNYLAGIIPLMKKDSETSWLNNIIASSLQQSLKNLDQSFKNFFNSKNGKRKGRKISFPKFKSKKTCRASFTIVASKYGIEVKDNYLKIPKLGFVKVWSGFKRLNFKETIKRVTFSRDSDNHWYASILIDREPKVYESTGITQGLDLGIKTTAMFSCGVEANIPDKIKKLEKKIKKLNRRLHRKVLGSKNREKARLKLAKTYFRIRMLRDNFFHQLSKEVAEGIDILTVETLNIQGMLKNHKLSKAISTQGWYKFITFLKYKLEKSGKIFIQVSKTFPSTKLCSSCGYENNNLTLSDREWICPSCGTNHNRDINAAKNLDNVSRWFKLTGEVITTKVGYINSIVPALGTI